MNRLSRERRSQVLRALVEGNSIRATCRMTGTAKGTVLTLLEDVGAACLDYQDRVLRDLPCTRLQCDEIWSFCHAKEKKFPKNTRASSATVTYGPGRRSMLIPSSSPPSLSAGAMLQLPTPSCSIWPHGWPKRVQLTTDGHKPYLEAVEGAFGADIDYAILIKLYGADPESERRYSPAQCVGAEQRRIMGSPDPTHISTSYVERQNLTMRMQRCAALLV